MRKATATATLAMALALAGCGIFAQDGEDNAPRHFATPVLNEASRNRPFAQPMGEAMPDTAWVTEAASECEPWQTRDNGCGRDLARPMSPGHTRVTRVRRIGPVRHHVRRMPTCLCEKPSARDAGTTAPVAQTPAMTSPPKP